MCLQTGKLLKVTKASAFDSEWSVGLSKNHSLIKSVLLFSIFLNPSSWTELGDIFSTKQLD